MVSVTFVCFPSVTSGPVSRQPLTASRSLRFNSPHCPASQALSGDLAAYWVLRLGQKIVLIFWRTSMKTCNDM
jgi:hypothetical protein